MAYEEELLQVQGDAKKKGDPGDDGANMRKQKQLQVYGVSWRVFI